jgi:ribonuclease P protein subunit RPR2
MGKRFDKKKQGKTKASRESDAALRLTYLWSAAHVISQSGPASSRFYVGCIKQVGRRVTLPLDALTMKRNACKECNALLLPGQRGTTVRIVPSREKHVVVTCGSCKAVRRYLARPPCSIKNAENSGGAVDATYASATERNDVEVDDNAEGGVYKKVDAAYPVGPLARTNVAKPAPAPMTGLFAGALRFLTRS